jgi:serine/threonine protein phosphatase PrpC
VSESEGKPLTWSPPRGASSPTSTAAVPPVTTATHTGGWRVIARSVTGPSHRRAGTDNQDAESHDVHEELVIVAVADGHGSPKSFRSDTGARLAVEVAMQTGRELINDHQKSRSPIAVIKDAATNQLPRRLEKHWKKRVYDHSAANPLTQAELDRLVAAAGRAAREAAAAHGIAAGGTGQYLAYGTTLLVAYIASDFVLYLQLGDGDILSVSDTANGDVSRPIPRDEQLIANETTSLCQKDAWKLFRIQFQYIHASAPALILLSTDGYANSFRSNQDFLKVGTDLLRILRHEGPGYVEREMRGWLEGASSAGSGDDATLALAYRPATLVISDLAGLAPAVAEGVGQESDAKPRPDHQEPTPDWQG